MLTIVIDEAGEGEGGWWGFIIERGRVKRPIKDPVTLEYSVPFDHAYMLLGLSACAVDIIALPSQRDHYRPYDLARMLCVRKALKTYDIYH